MTYIVAKPPSKSEPKVIETKSDVIIVIEPREFTAIKKFQVIATELRVIVIKSKVIESSKLLQRNSESLLSSHQLLKLSYKTL
jgi:hypothetical protein